MSCYLLEVQSDGRDSVFLFFICYSVDAANFGSTLPLSQLAAGVRHHPGSELRGGRGALQLNIDLATVPAFFIIAGTPAP